MPASSGPLCTIRRFIAPESSGPRRVRGQNEGLRKFRTWLTGSLLAILAMASDPCGEAVHLRLSLFKGGNLAEGSCRFPFEVPGRTVCVEDISGIPSDKAC